MAKKLQIDIGISDRDRQKIAERIRALGFPAPGTYKEFMKLASIQEVKGVPRATEMIHHLLAAQ